MSRLIDAYLAEFDRELSFDRKLAKRVHQEVEAHLREAMDDSASEVDAIRRFGNPQALARDYAEAALPSRIRMTWTIALAVAVTTFVFMRLRSIWIGFPEIDGSDVMMLTAIDRAGFGAGMLFSLYAWHVSKQGAHRMFPPLLGAGAAFLLSVIASLSKASILSPEFDALIYVTGSAEIFMIAAAAVQIRLLRQHITLAGT